MGNRKRLKAEARKEARKSEYVAELVNVPTSPRKMRLVADLVRGMEVERALHTLKFTSKEAAGRVETLLLSAISNWEQKTGETNPSGLVVKEVHVDGGRMLKRLQTAPQGRAHRVRKRSNHVTLVIDSKK